MVLRGHSTVQYITRKGNFDSGHRVMNEQYKCYNLHGHTYLYELTFNFQQMEDIGYALDFKEIKRVGCQWIDDLMDHGMILNPKDEQVIRVVQNLNTKLWLMSLNGKGEYCNPSVENIAREVILAEKILFEDYPMLDVSSVKIFETPNCWTELSCTQVPQREKDNFYDQHYTKIKTYARHKGILEYDDRKSDAVAL